MHTHLKKLQTILQILTFPMNFSGKWSFFSLYKFPQSDITPHTNSYKQSHHSDQQRKRRRKEGKMNLQKCLVMALIWVACLLLSMATEAEAQSYGSSAERTSSNSMLLKFLGLVVSFVILKQMVWVLWFVILFLLLQFPCCFHHEMIIFYVCIETVWYKVAVWFSNVLYCHCVLWI